MKKTFYTLITLFCLLFTLVLTAHADFGSYSGDSDYGSYDDYSWSSYDDDDDYSWSSYDDDDDYSWSSYDDDDDYGYGYSSSYSSNDDIELTDNESAALGAIILAVIIFLIWRSRRNRKKYAARYAARNQPAGATRTAVSALRPITEYQAIDPYFDTAAIRESLSNLYVKMQNGWTAKDIESLRPYFTDAFFTQMERQLNQMKKQGVTNYVERIAVLAVDLKGFRQQNGEDHIIAELHTRIVDYTLQDASGKLVSGDRKKEKFMAYEWDVCRTTGKVSLERSGTDTVVCPSCGAPLDMNVSARCPYCDSVVNRSDHDWALCSIKGLAQRTGTTGRGSGARKAKGRH